MMAANSLFLSTDNSNGVHYEEERAIGEDLHIGTFDGTIKKLFMISGDDVIAYNSSNGDRLNIYKHQNSVIGVFIHNNIMFTYTKNNLVLWQIEAAEQILSLCLEFPGDYEPLWFYQYDKKHYILAQNRIDGNQNATLFQIYFDKIDWNSFLINHKKPADNVINPKLICHVGITPATKQNFVVENKCCIKSVKKTITVFYFKVDGNKDDGTHSSIQKEFTLNTNFNVDNQELIEFNQLCIAGDSLYASLNIGRIYIWSQFKETGFNSTNSSNLTLTGYQPVICISQNGTMFVGAGNGLIYKYKVDATSGVGRWDRLEFIQMEAPAQSLSLNEDLTILIVVLIDNTVCTIQTSEMKVLTKFQLLNMSQIREITDARFGIVNDPLHSEQIVANARFGHIQWIDPFEWKTVKLLNVADENLPCEDTFNRPNHLWLNAYLIYLSVATIVTCECRRNDNAKTYMKFWKRDIIGSLSKITLIDCFILNQRVIFIRSTLGQYYEKEVTKALTEAEEILCINEFGNMDVYIKDLKRNNHWHRDLTRHESNWQGSEIKYCSNIRVNVFSTINALSTEQTNILVWNLDKFNILRLLDSLKGANQVEWSPQPTTFLIACKSGIVAFDYTLNLFVWVILESGLLIMASPVVTFAFNEYDVFIIDPKTGTLEKNPLKFKGQQRNIIAVSKEGKLSFAGINNQGSLSLLRPKLDKDMPSAFKKSDQVKRTAFSLLVKRNKRQKSDDHELTNDIPSERISLKHISIKEFVDGPAYSLPPISILAQQFVDACLTQKR